MGLEITGHRRRPGEAIASAQGGGFLPSGVVAGSSQAAYVDPLHPSAVDDGDLTTPFVTPQGAVTALDTALSGAKRLGTVLLAAGVYAVNTTLPAGRFWQLVPVGGHVQLGDVTLEMDGTAGGLAAGAIFGPTLDVIVDADVGFRINALVIVDTGGGGGVADIVLDGGRCASIDAAGHGGTQRIRLNNLIIPGVVNAPGATLNMRNVTMVGALTVDLYERLDQCTFTGAPEFTSGIGAADNSGFYDCIFIGGPTVLTGADDIRMDEVSLASFQRQLWTFAGGAFLVRWGNTTRTIWFPINLPTGLTGIYPTVDIAVAITTNIGFRLPFDFGTIVSLDIIANPAAGAAGAGRDFEVLTNAGAVGESNANHVNGPTDVTPVNTGTTAFWFAIDISDRIPLASAGDYVGVRVENDAGNGGNVAFAGIQLTYRPA